jgi:hypothetical protein
VAQTATELYNTAAQAMQARGRLTSANSTSRYTEVFDLWYPRVRSLVLAAAHWPSCLKTAPLSLSATRTQSTNWTASSPKPGYKYAYTAPPDLLHPQYLSTYGHFAMGMIGDTKCIFAHEQNAILHYTFDQTNEGSWEPQLFLCVALSLAAFTAQTITGKRSIRIDLQNQANDLIQQQRGVAAEWQDDPIETVASWHTARGYVGPETPARFVFPHGPLVAVGQSANVK